MNRTTVALVAALALAGCGWSIAEAPDVDPAYQAAVEREAYARMPPGTFQQPRLGLPFMGGLRFAF